MFKRKNKKAAAGKKDEHTVPVDAILPPIEYNAELAGTNIETLCAHLQAIGCQTRFERIPAGKDHGAHYNVTASLIVGDTTRTHSGKVFAHATETECEDFFKQTALVFGVGL